MKARIEARSDIFAFVCNVLYDTINTILIVRVQYSTVRVVQYGSLLRRRANVTLNCTYRYGTKEEVRGHLLWTK